MSVYYECIWLQTPCATFIISVLYMVKLIRDLINNFIIILCLLFIIYLYYLLESHRTSTSQISWNKFADRRENI